MEKGPQTMNYSLACMLAQVVSDEARNTHEDLAIGSDVTPGVTRCVPCQVFDELYFKSVYLPLNVSALQSQKPIPNGTRVRVYNAPEHRLGQAHLRL